MVMELAFSIDRDGLVQDSHAKAYAALGGWVRECYGAPLAVTTRAVEGDGGKWSYDVAVPAGTVFDRFQLREDIVVGQRVRHYTVSMAEGGGGDFKQLYEGQSIGTKWIILLDNNVTTTAIATTLRLTVDKAIAPPVLKQFAVFAPCPAA